MLVSRDLLPHLRDAALHFPSITLTGPRQSGKSTLCRMAFPDLPHVNLEALDARRRATADPIGFLAALPRGAILDEVQRAPELLSYIQVLIDEERFQRRDGATQDATPGRLWVLTGSFNFTLLSSVSQSLAGRTAVMHLLPLSWNEIALTNRVPQTLEDAILAGGYPAPFDQQVDRQQWLGSYVTTYLERDARDLTSVQDLQTFQSFLSLCAGRTAQLLNITSLGADAGVAQSTAKAWLGVLEAIYVALRITPWFRNTGKRLAKTPKLHLYDTGIACWLLGIHTAEQLRTHPLRGPLFESWVAIEILKHRLHRGELRPIHFYRDAAGREADLLIDHGTQRTIVEAKSGRTVADDAIRATERVAAVLETTVPSRRVVVYGGDERQRRTDVDVVPWREVHSISWV